MHEFAGKTALVTGAASGIGRETAEHFGRAGANVVLLDRDRTGAEAAAAAIGSSALVIEADLIDLENLGSAVDRALAHFGSIDFLLNIAAFRPIPDVALAMDPEVWAKVMMINVIAPAKLIALAAPAMIARGRGGKIVNVSSSSAFRSAGSPPAAYACSKAAIAALTRVTAAELGPHGINVNTVVPGATRTALAVAAGMSDRLEEIVREGPLSNLMQRVSEPEDVAGVIAFLCSNQSRQITGQSIHTSAGLVV